MFDRLIPETKRASWILASILLSAYSTKIFAYMGNFNFEISTKDWILFFSGVIFVILLAGLGPAFLIYKRVKKKWVFALTPFLGILILVLIYGFLLIIGVRI